MNATNATDAVLETAGLIEQARAWIAQDPDPETRDELSTLVIEADAGSREAVDDLHSRFDTRLAFGTAGLRGEIAAGPNRMNRVLVAQAAAGFARYLLDHAEGGTPSVVIGFDGRKNSDVFARDTAELMAGAGIRAILLPRLMPTPVLAFAVRHLDVSAGVMVTASHNPPNDNGYKVYLGGEDHGSQIVSPVDSEIASRILEVAQGSVTELVRSEAYEIAPEDLEQDYVTATAGVARSSAPRDAVSFAYTAMHGVGWRTAQQVFARAGFAEPAIVAAQIDPDPAFPTVAFPNPEEPGAMDLSFATAREARTDLVIANDPDADRLAVAIPDPSAPDGYRRLSGNEVGALLGWRAAELAAAAADAGDDRDSFGTLACSIVSSPALKAVAGAYRLDFEETLTGFKWVSRATGLLYGYEEALGYLVNPGSIRDKDGISAAVAFLDLANSLATEGRTIADQLVAFSERFGHFASDQISIRVTDLSEIDRIMAALRATPPKALGAVRVSQIDDLSDGFGALPPSDVLRILLEDGSRVMVRPSGTEPKLKIYIDASSDDGSAAERQATAEARVAALAAAMRELTEA
ncbi:phospho-sugar mutase [Leifsonia sp. NPDC058248]|uniref:phospho-sugar mutase n=1 Tax=Leifsonia sp. NPDC058248 TaxID=3346402 RepID=UPI0036DE45A1